VKRTFLTWYSCLWILDKDRELAEAYTEIKALKSTERLKEKAFEEVIPQYSFVCGYGRLAPSSTFDRTVAHFLFQKVLLEWARTTLLLWPLARSWHCSPVCLTMMYAMAHCCITSTSLTLCVAFGILQVCEELKKVNEKLKAAEIALENKVQKSANFTIVAFFSAVSVHGFFGHFCAALKAVFGVLQSYSWKCMQNLEVKKINDEKKTALAAQFAAEATLRRVHAAQKDEDLPPIEAILAPLEAELRLTYKEVMCLAAFLYVCLEKCWQRYFQES
jgi:flavodoxin